MAQKITCPVCFTKMNPAGHDMVCPECGYKYCEGRVPYTYDDHNHNEYKSYNQKTSYNTGYTTAQGSAATPQSTTTYGSYSNPQSRAASGTYASPQSSAASSTYSSTQSTAASGAYATPQRSTSSGTYSSVTSGSYSAGRRPKKTSVGKFIFMLVVFYIIIVVIALFFSFVTQFLATGGSHDIFEKLFSAKGQSSHNEATISIETHYKSAEELLDDYKRLSNTASPKTLTQALLCEATSKQLNQITKRDCERFLSIQIYPDEYGLSVKYVLDSEDEAPQLLQTAYEEFDPSEIQLFTNLQVFRVSDGLEVSFEPGQLHDLRDLYYLTCSNTPEELVRIVDPFQLEILYIEAPSRYVDLDKLNEFVNLSTFCIVAQELGHASQIGELPNLYYLDIITDWENPDYSFLESLKYLRYLYLTDTYLDDVSFLRGLKDLDTLVITDTYDLTDISAVSSCTELTALELSNVPGIEDFSPIGELTKLQYFVIDACELKDLSWASSLKEVAWISIEDNQVSSLAPLAALPNLDAVFCSGNDVTDFGKLNPAIVEME